jgi:hypothetical protein
MTEVSWSNPIAGISNKEDFPSALESAVMWSPDAMNKYSCSRGF